MKTWRKTTWAIVVWTAFIAYWLYSGLQSAPITTNAEAAGAGIAIFFILFVWVLILIPLSLLWFGTRPRSV
jgi:hypothetical protein